MNKPTFDAMVAQYAVQEASGEGAASWDGGVRCVLPEVLVYGKAVQDGTPTPDAPVMPEFSSGTTVVSRGKNLIKYPYYHQSGRVHHGITFTVRSDRGIAVQGTVTGSAYFILMEGCDFGEVYISSISSESGTNGLYTTNKGLVYDPTNRTLSLQIWEGVVADEIYYPQIEVGTTATPYVPYHDGGTAVAPELLAIPGTEYRDEWNPQTGKGVRRVGKLVLDDGMEIYVANGTYPYFYLGPISPAIKGNGIYSHGLYDHRGVETVFPDAAAGVYESGWARLRGPEHITTVGDFKDWLAAQYAAGTPVTVWYALAEPIEFQTAPAPLIAPKGTGHIMQVGGNLDGCPITAKYVTHS